MIWLATEGDLALSNLDDKKYDEEHKLFLQKLHFIAHEINYDLDRMKNWVISAKKLRSFCFKSPLANLKFKLYKKA